MIKVLWLEDELEKIEAFLDRAYMAGIEVTHKDTANNFIAELNGKIDHYDAVILDVMGVVDSLSEKPSSSAFKAAYDSILALKYKKQIPFFVLSAQLTKDENQGLKEYIGETNVYIKSKDEERLIESINASVANQQDYALRKKYTDLLSVFNDDHLGQKHFDRIFNLIKWVESSKEIDNTEDQLTRIRKIIEAVFQSLAKKGFVPTEITNTQGWLNGTRSFLANKHSAFIQIDAYIHPTASDSILHLLDIIQDGSHAEGGLRLKVDEYIQLNQSDYLFKSCVYLLFDVIIWYKNLTNKYTDIDENKKKWISKINQSSLNLIGKLKQDSDNRYFIGQYIFQYDKVHGIYKIDDEIEIIQAIENIKSTNTKYPFFVVKFKKH
jgi:hypothetical protein